MTPEVTAAIQELQDAFPGCRVEAVADGSGGALVTVYDVPFDEGPFAQAGTWVGFHITHTYPYCDVYPHFVRPDLSRRNGAALGEGMAVGTFRNQPAIQISRKSNRHNPVTDTAALKLLKVLRWLKSR
jgi:hypothetical protein